MSHLHWHGGGTLAGYLAKRTRLFVDIYLARGAAFELGAASATALNLLIIAAGRGGYRGETRRRPVHPWLILRFPRFRWGAPSAPPPERACWAALAAPPGCARGPLC